MCFNGSSPYPRLKCCWLSKFSCSTNRGRNSYDYSSHAPRRIFCKRGLEHNKNLYLQAHLLIFFLLFAMHCGAVHLLSCNALVPKGPVHYSPVNPERQRGVCRYICT
eukprot:sb/3477646/